MERGEQVEAVMAEISAINAELLTRRELVTGGRRARDVRLGRACRGGAVLANMAVARWKAGRW